MKTQKEKKEKIIQMSRQMKGRELFHELDVQQTKQATCDVSY